MSREKPSPWDCERPGCGSDQAHDYCDTCGKNLCRRCMAEGHCGNYPTRSGLAADAPTELETPEEAAAHEQST